MITEYINRFKEIQPRLLEAFTKEQPDSYGDILCKTLELMFREEDSAGYGKPNYDDFHTIDDGDYQGTQVFIIPEYGYQPHTYWAVKVSYGSCSGCDTYQRYASWDEEGYADSAPHMVTMALHMIESMKEI